MDAGNTTVATVSNLDSGNTYYFVVVAYNSASTVSAPSNEVSYSLTDVNPTPSPTPSATPFPSATPIPTASPRPTATPRPSATPKQGKTKKKNSTVSAALSHICTTGNVGSDGRLVGEFVISGKTTQPVVIRALGPSLAASGVTGALSDTMITLYNAAGAVISSNDDWQTPYNASVASLAPADPREAAISATLAPGTYTCAITGKNNEAGVAALDLYRLTSKSAEITQLFTAANVNSPDKVLSGTFTISSATSHRVLIRALGPSLAGSTPAQALADPVLELYDATGSLIYENNSWKEVQQQQIQDSGRAPSDDRECAIIATLSPGTYTARVRSGDTSEGNARLELYDLGQ